MDGGIRKKLAIFMKTFLSVVAMSLVSMTLVFAMGPRGEKNLPPAPEKKETVAPLTIGKVTSDPSGFKEKKIVLEGIFRGWNGKCESSRPLTRSDWILEDETGCIYVTGKVPSSLSPMAPKGERISVSGTVKPLVRAEAVSTLPER